MCSFTVLGGGSGGSENQSVSGVTTIFLTQCNTSPLATRCGGSSEKKRQIVMVQLSLHYKHNALYRAKYTRLYIDGGNIQVVGRLCV